MNIGIVGAGYIGSALAKIATDAGHSVRISNSRGPETLSEVAAETGATAVTAAEAVKGADLVVITIPEKSVVGLADDLFFDVGDDLTIVDTGNYYPGRDGKIEEIENGTTESNWVSEQIGRPVVKAFNQIWYKNLRELGKPAGSPDRVALPYAGDVPDMKTRAAAFIESIGFDALDAGTLDESWRQQPGSPCYTKVLNVEDLRAALASASSERPEDFKA